MSDGRLDYELRLDESDYIAGFRRANNQLVDFRRSKAGASAGTTSFATVATRATLVLGGLTAAAGLARAAFLQFAQVDRMERALAATMGSADAARARLVALRDVAKNPGLGLEEAVQADIRLQAVSITAQRSERIIRSVGNALASAGAGKAELDGVITALSQMAAKGVVSAEEINQIAERMPQIRKAMKDAFGTADTEVLQKMKVSVDDFVDGVVSQLERLPKATGGPANAIENLEDSWKNLKTSLGGAIAPALTPLITGAGDLADAMARATDGQSFEEVKRLAAEGAKFQRDQAAAAAELRQHEEAIVKAKQASNIEAERAATQARIAAEAAERKAKAEKDTRSAALASAQASADSIRNNTVPEPQRIADDLDKALDDAFSRTRLINGQVSPEAAKQTRDQFTTRDLANAADAEQDPTRKAALLALLARIVELQTRQKDLAKAAADETERAAKAAADEAKQRNQEADARAKAAGDFELEGQILKAKIAGNAKLVEQLEREQKVRALTLQIMRDQGKTEEAARAEAAARVGLIDRAEKGPRRGLKTAEESAQARFDRLSPADRRKRAGFQDFLDRDPTTRGQLADRTRRANAALAQAVPAAPAGQAKPDTRLADLAANQSATLKSIDQRLAALGLAS